MANQEQRLVQVNINQSINQSIKQDSADDENMSGLQAVRGKKTKVAKAKAKYADQDEEDRELTMQFLGAAGKSQATVLVNVNNQL